jgi:1,4-dihydroxy-2-naphthoate octaprenyltransferase
MRFADIVVGARPRTLGAAITPVVVGTFASPVGSVPRFLLCLAVALGLQIGVNLVNDAADGVRGVDAARIGPPRLVASGRASARSVWAAASVSIGIAAAAGIWLAALVGWELLAVGAAMIVALFAYSAGPKPYAALGLGETLAFICFGLVATIGTAYVHAERLLEPAVWAAVPIGLCAVAMMLVNNVRDIDTDAAAGKRTLAVRLGRARSVAVFRVVLVTIFVTIGVAVRLDALPAEASFAFVALPLAVGPWRAVSSQDPRELIGALKQCAMLQLQVGLGLCIGFVFA